jgi:hypothetical protein
MPQQALAGMGSLIPRGLQQSPGDIFFDRGYNNFHRSGDSHHANTAADEA